MVNTHVVVLGTGCGIGIGFGFGRGFGIGCGAEAVLTEPVLEEDVLKIKMKRYLTLHWKY